MKKLISLLLIAVMSISLIACGDDEKNNAIERRTASENFEKLKEDKAAFDEEIKEIKEDLGIDETVEESVEEFVESSGAPTLEDYINESPETKAYFDSLTSSMSDSLGGGNGAIEIKGNTLIMKITLPEFDEKVLETLKLTMNAQKGELIDMFNQSCDDLERQTNGQIVPSIEMIIYSADGDVVLDVESK